MGYLDLDSWITQWDKSHQCGNYSLQYLIFNFSLSIMSEEEHMLSAVIVFGDKRIEEKSKYPLIAFDALNTVISSVNAGTTW